MKDVFLSYARKDLAEIEVLSGDLRGLGYSPWYDVELTGGIEWWSRILERIRQADVFVFAISGTSVESQACLTEYRYAKALRRLILPVHVADNVRLSTLPVEVASLQLLDYRSADKKSAILLSRTLLEIPLASPLPEPLPEEPRQPMSYLAELREQIDAREISFDGQAGLVVKMRSLMREPASREEVVELAARLQRRRDVYQQVYKDIEDMLSPQVAQNRTKDFISETPVLRTKPTETSVSQEQPAASTPNTPPASKLNRIFERSNGISSSKTTADPFLSALARTFHQDGYKAISEKYSDTQLMSMLGISQEGRLYLFRTYRYERLADAVSYALKVTYHGIE